MLVKTLGRIAGVGLLVAASTVTAHAADTMVDMLSNNEFSPENVTVQVGDTVTWVNRDTVVHDSVARDPAVTWNTGFLEPNAQAAVTFDSVGTYFYHCRIHPGMTGRVFVEAAAPAPPATDTALTVAASPDPGSPLPLVGAALVGVLAVVRRTRARRDDARSGSDASPVNRGSVQESGRY